MIVVASYSFLSCWDTCRHRAYRQYIAKDLPKAWKERQTVEQLWGDEVHGAIQARINDGRPLPEVMPWEHLVAPLVEHGAVAEKKLGVKKDGSPCDFFDGEVFLRGKLDAPIVCGEHALLIDWKTGDSKYENPFELEIGALLLQAKYPQVRKITGRYAWLKEGRLGQEHDCSATLNTWSTVCAKMRDVENEREFLKTQGPLCKFCPVKDCQHNRSKV
jgi:hypothetical protein